MKKLILMAAVVATTASFGQNSTFKNVKVNSKTTETSESATTVKADAPVVKADPTIVHKGFRIGLKKGSYDGKIKMELLGVSDTDDIDIDNKIGISVGYNLIQVGSVGFIGNFTYRSMEVDSKKVNSYTFDGSANYAFDKVFYVLGGLSMTYAKLPSIPNKDSGASYEHKPSIGYGLQVGAGLQVAKNLSVELTHNYLTANGKYQVSGIDIDTYTTAYGFELGIIGTF